MATIKIENFPDDLYEALREQAERNGRSTSDEVNDIIDWSIRLERLTSGAKPNPARRDSRT